MKKLFFLVIIACMANLSFANNCPAPDTAVVINATNNNYFAQFKLEQGGTYYFRWKLPSETIWNETTWNIQALYFNLGNLPDGKTYQAQIERQCKEGNFKGKIFTFKTKAPNVPCIEPDVEIKEIFNDGALISWNNVPGAVKYRVTYRFANLNSGWSSEEINDTSYLFNTMGPDQTWEFYVETFCAGQAKVASDVLSFTTLNAPLCVAPTNVNISEVTSKTAVVKWTKSAKSKIFTVDYKVVGTTLWKSVKSSTNSIMLQKLNPKTQYEVRVSVQCENTYTSEYTAIVNFTTSPKKKTFTNGEVKENNLSEEVVFQKIQKNTNNQITIYPNPSGQFINIKGISTQDNNLNISILNLSGSVVLNTNLTEQIDISSLENGVYFARINGENTPNKAYKFVVMKN